MRYSLSVRIFFDFLSRHKRHVATLALVFGFVVDIITFQNLNLTLALWLLSAHLVIVAGSIFILSIPNKGERGLAKFIHSWLPVALQYSTGNLLSAFLVLYSGSGSLVQSWPFFALVAVAAIGNEGLRFDTSVLPFRTTLLYLNILLFSALAVPVRLGAIGMWTFLTSVAVSSAVFIAYIYLGRLFLKTSFRGSFGRIQKNAATILFVFLVLYFTNLIPPIPLSIKAVDFYHDVYKTNAAYIGLDEKRPFYERFFSLSGITLHLSSGSPAFVYTAIFAPAKLNTSIVHRWQYFDTSSGTWVTKNEVSFPIIGGRNDGYRGYSFTENPEAGKWRVVVATARGQVVGRAYVTIRHPEEEVSFSAIVLE